MADAGGSLVGSGERLGIVVVVAVDNADDLLGVDLKSCRADAVRWFINRNLAAIGRIERQIYVVDAVEAGGQFLVFLNNDFLCQFGIGRNVADSHSENKFAVVLDVGDLDDGCVDFAEEAVADFLGHLAQVEVAVVGVVGVDALAQVGNVLIGRAAVDGVGAGQNAVGAVRG